MTDLYLIAHKVHGEPAFDIAIMLDVLDEDGDPIWIIPTSGHRAFPYQVLELAPLIAEYRADNWTTIPEGWPDHYPCNDRPIRGEKAPSLLDRLNLKPVQPPIIRRI